MIDFLWNLASFVVALGILVTVHEYGHFWVARKSGVKVERFSVGFGKAIFKRTGKDGTEYVLALIPLGGYVKMLDERVDDVLPEDKNKTFNSKSLYQRIAIVAAGPIANFVFALFALYLMFLIGVPSVKPVIGNVAESSIASKAGLTSNAEIVSINGNKTRDWQEVNFALIGEIGNKEIEIKSKQGDGFYIATSVLDTKDWRFSPDKVSALTSLGITPYRPNVHNELATVADESPAKLAGLQVGDVLVGVNGKSLDTWVEFSQEIKLYPAQEVLVTINRGGNIMSLPLTPKSIEQNGKTIGYIGVAPKADAWPESQRIELSYGPIDALTESAKRTWNLTSLTFGMIGKLITGDVSVKNLSGPIGIAQGAGSSAEHGFVYFLGFLALISINLGIINLLPLPVLDGGHLLYYLIELFTGKEVPEKVQESGFKFGALALLTLMAIGLFNDFGRVLG
ncbi:sigma E protease regulator RseP [Colwellia sp. E2M01]|uniref:sigma E protease regulator RseP n=1 Tax=Colwellia sp. E2M01 TaxID=2841561 RepID=UPI001C08A55F|nr:sigma E protease regulator RseP [Colwellia sp. E2M01]MBU2869894.1 sigma E protease regulator RseP [Colwellia sp. E2M01]